MSPATGPPRVLALWCPDWQDDIAHTPPAREFEQVVKTVENFCPAAEIVRPGQCVISASGPARYFGGEDQLVQKITAAVTVLGYTCQAGIADGMFAATLAARTGVIVPAGKTPAFLAPLPIRVLGNPELEALLPRLGIHTVGQFAALPAAAALTRLGPQAALAHQLACGQQPRPLAARPAAEDLSACHEFDPPASLAEPVVFTAKTVAAAMHAQLAARGLACVRVQITVVTASGAEITRLWRHDGLLSAQAVAERVRWQLDGWAPGRADDEHPAGAGGICQLRLIPDQLVPATGRQLGLWGDDLVSDRVARAAVQVQALLGHAAVLRPLLAGGRRPAEEVTLVPFGEDASPARARDRPWPGRLPAPAPATVYPEPRPAQVTGQSGAPVTVSGRGQVSEPPAYLAFPGRPPEPLTAWAGPWPLTQRWWQHGGGVRQARFQLLTAAGAWLAVVQGGRWLLEASYDLTGHRPGEDQHWDGTTLSCRGASSSGAWPAAATSGLATTGPLRRSAPPSHRRTGPGRQPGQNCTATPPSASWTGHRPPPSWWPRRPGSGSPPWRSPTMTACTGCRSSPRPPPGWPPTPASRWARSSAPSSPSPPRPPAAPSPTPSAATCWYWPVTPRATGCCAG
jgi:protein ImuB